MSGTYAPVGGCMLVLIFLSPFIFCCCLMKIGEMQAQNYHNRRITPGQVMGQIAMSARENNPDPPPALTNTVSPPTNTVPPPSLSNTLPPPQAPPGYNLVPQSDIPVPPGFKLVLLSELHGPQAPPPGYTLVKL